MFASNNGHCVGSSMSTHCCAGATEDPLGYLNRLVRGNNSTMRSESLCGGTRCSNSGSRAWIVFLLPCTGLRTRCLRFIRAVLTEEGRGEVTDLNASPGRQVNVNQLRPKDPPPMVIQGDFRKVSGITSEIFKQLEIIENDYDISTAAALEAVEKHGEMVVRIIEPRQMGRHASEAAKKFLSMQDPKLPIHFVEIIKRPGQTLGLYIREGNGMDRNDGVFISRIALETAVYNSGCLKVGDEILAVNIVDVTHMSLDDVVIIMSIPRRLLLAIRHGPHQLMTHNRSNEHKGPPVVVIKKDLDEDETDHITGNHISTLERDRRRGDGREMLPSRSKLGLSGLGSTQEIISSNGDLYYNSRPESHLGWSYQPPPPPIITQQPKPGPTQHFQPYDRGYPKTLESLAEKVHSFYPSASSLANGSRRITAGSGMHTIGRMGSSGYASAYVQNPGRIIPRSGSDQHLPRVDYASIATPARHTLLRSNLKTGSAALRFNSRYGTNDLLSQATRQPQYGTLTRRHRPALDYASDTEATCSSSPRSAYYYYRNNMANPTPSSAVSHLATLSRSQIGQSAGLRTNSLPRSVRPLGHQTSFRPGLSTLASSLIDEDDGALSAPEMPSVRRDKGRIPSSSGIFSADEYKAWLCRTPSTSALYDQLRTTNRPPRYTYSAENIHAAVNQADYATYGYRPMASTLDRLTHRSASAHQVNLANLRASTAISSSGHRPIGNVRASSVTSNVRAALANQKTLGSAATQRANSIRRMRGMMDMEPTTMSNRTAMPTSIQARPVEQRLLDINPAEFLKYKLEKPPTIGTPGSTSSLLSSLAENASTDFVNGISGLLWVHLLAGRGLRATTATSAVTPPSALSSNPSLVNCSLRDLYCVLECDRIHKARTVVRTGDLMFDWDENFELDLVGNRQLDLLVYSWDPQYRHKLCYKGSVYLATLLKESPLHQLAVKVEPRGTIYLRLRYTDVNQTFRRRGLPVISMATRIAPLFGIDLETVVNREAKTGGVPGGVSTALAMGGSGVPNVPIIVWRCVEEVERRGLDIIGLYRLCGSATKKRILREAFERNARSVDLSSDNVPDINVITGVLKDYLRELPEPLFTKCLYQMMVDALAVCIPDDPQGNAKLMFSILDCLPTVNKCTLIYLLDHLALVISQCNKMSPASLAVCFGPVLMLHSDDMGTPLDFQQPIAVLKYLLEIWPVKSVRKITSAVSTLPRTTTAHSNSSNSNSITQQQHPPVSSASQILHQHLIQQQQQQQQPSQQQQDRQQLSSIQLSPQLQQSQQQQQSPQQPQQQQQILQSQPVQQQSQSPQRGTLPRTGLLWQQQPSPLQQPPTTTASPSLERLQSDQQSQRSVTTTATPRPPPPPPVKPRQIIDPSRAKRNDTNEQKVQKEQFGLYNDKIKVIVSSPGSLNCEESGNYQELVKMGRSNLQENRSNAATNAGSFQESTRFNRMPNTTGAVSQQETIKFNPVSTSAQPDSTPIKFSRTPASSGNSTIPQESIRFTRAPLTSAPSIEQDSPSPRFNRLSNTSGSPNSQNESVQFSRMGAIGNSSIPDSIKFNRSPIAGSPNSTSSQQDPVRSTANSSQQDSLRYVSDNSQQDSMKLTSSTGQQDSARFTANSSQQEPFRFTSLASTQQDSPRFSTNPSQQDSSKYSSNNSQQVSPRFSTNNSKRDSPRFSATNSQQDPPRFSSNNTQQGSPRFSSNNTEQGSPRFMANSSQFEPLRFNASGSQQESSRTTENSNSYEDSIKYARSPVGTSPISYQDALSKFNRVATGNNPGSIPGAKPRVHSTNPFLNSMSNGNGSSSIGHGSVLPANFFGNGTGELVTPTSSVGTEDGGAATGDDAEHGVDADIEASDDDCLNKIGGKP